ncbi:MAG TPA: dihydropteroate synthase [Actinomycetota bacterium]|nr:dihydropteroate synthase [Actinomycetota bacterium]
MGIVWRCRDRELSLGERTLVMGIVNVTPDSFSDGGMFDDADAAVKHGLQLLEEGADILDVGGESTRPGSIPVDEDEELARVLPVIEGLRREAPEAILSVDTRKAAVASEALAAGTDVVNDIGAGADPGMFGVVASAGAGMVLMHMQGEPKTMQSEPRYGDVVGEVRSFLAERLGGAVAAGIGRDRLCVDPGIGFGKTPDQNLALLHELAMFRQLGRPVLLGTSRKSTIGHVLDLPAHERLEGTLATTALGIAAGVDIVRVHDVLANVRAARMSDAVLRRDSRVRPRAP